MTPRDRLFLLVLDREIARLAGAEVLSGLTADLDSAYREYALLRADFAARLNEGRL